MAKVTFTIEDKPEGKMMVTADFDPEIVIDENGAFDLTPAQILGGILYMTLERRVKMMAESGEANREVQICIL